MFSRGAEADGKKTHRSAQDVNVPRYRLTCAGNTSDTTVSANFDRDVFRPGDVTSPPVAGVFRDDNGQGARYNYDSTSMRLRFDGRSTALRQLDVNLSVL